jgi:hypothetical protein
MEQERPEERMILGEDEVDEDGTLKTGRIMICTVSI